jgi:hypothetical protein
MADFKTRCPIVGSNNKGPILPAIARIRGDNVTRAISYYLRITKLKHSYHLTLLN